MRAREGAEECRFFFFVSRFLVFFFFFPENLSTHRQTNMSKKKFFCFFVLESNRINFKAPPALLPRLLLNLLPAASDALVLFSAFFFAFFTRIQLGNCAAYTDTETEF